MPEPSLADLLASFDVTLETPCLDRLERFAGELLRWNRQRNLTAITDPMEVREKHLADSLALLPFLEEKDRLLDLGSGAGFPSLPLKIACPGLEIVSIDAVAKKIAFQKHVVRTLRLNGFTALHGRAEELVEHPACREGFSLITARALTALPQLVALSEPYLAPGGRLIAMKGGDGPREWADAQSELEVAGWSAELHAFRLPLSGAERTLLTLKRT